MIPTAEVDRPACGGTMALGSPKAQISGGKAACLSQRVEDNAFHLSTTYCQA